MQDMDSVFSALADRTRRHLLDSLYAHPGQTVNDLCGQFTMTRQGASKHLRILEEAELVVTRWKGREKLHYLNPVPVRSIYQRWIRKFDEAPADALIGLKIKMEEEKEEKI